MLYIPSERANLLWFSSNTDKRVRKRGLNDELWQSFCELDRAAWYWEPMINRVWYILRNTYYHGAMREREIERRVYGLGDMPVRDCTVKTALNRLMKMAIVNRRMVEHGCYRHYVYCAHDIILVARIEEDRQPDDIPF